MNSNAATKNYNTEQLTTWERAIEPKDIISELHESILGHVLSFLPTMDAVCTSVLSKRWIDVWTSLTSLKFEDSVKKMQKEQYVDFVNSVFLHLANSSIQNFFLCLTCYHYDASQVSSWISSILERGVQKLHIQYADEVLLSSHALFSCTSLVQLVLQVRGTLSVPIYACLPNLQHLSLSGIRLVSESTTYSKDIILSFPVLKVFEARACEWLTKQNINIQAPLLEKFSIAIWNTLSNESSCKPSIKISAPYLTDFSYEGDLEQDIILLNSSSIRSASVVIVIDEDKKDKMEKFGSQAHTLLSQIREVEYLKLMFYKVLMHAKDIFTHLPFFRRLTYLQLNEVTCEALLNIIHNSPILNTLVLQNGISESDKDVLSSTSVVPHCFLSSFKVFQFEGFNGHEHEHLLAKFMMANAAVLEQMTISVAFWLRYSNIDMEKVKEKILSFPKCSSFVKIEFSDVNNS